MSKLIQIQPGSEVVALSAVAKHCLQPCAEALLEAWSTFAKMDADHVPEDLRSLLNGVIDSYGDGTSEFMWLCKVQELRLLAEHFAHEFRDLLRGDALLVGYGLKQIIEATDALAERIIEDVAADLNVT